MKGAQGVGHRIGIVDGLHRLHGNKYAIVNHPCRMRQMENVQKHLPQSGNIPSLLVLGAPQH